jgi:hypothetical protein
MAKPKAHVLDPNAVSPSAEYARYLDGDLLGKIITRNLLINVLGFGPDQVELPIGRYGDAATKYLRDAVHHEAGDGGVVTQSGRVSVEIKCARISIANRSIGGTTQNWAHGGMLTTPAKKPKTYELLIAIGIEHLGLEDARYWGHLKEVSARRRRAGLPFSMDAMPHEPDFLSFCSFILMARTEVPSNFFRVNVATAGSDSFGPFQSWGSDASRCRARWKRALQAVAGSRAAGS